MLTNEDTCSSKTDLLTLREVCREGVRLLWESGIEQAEWESRELICYLTGFSLQSYLLHLDEEMPPGMHARFLETIALRCRHVPLQHITGKGWFYGRDFTVSPAVLIPRPETELLVEEALKRLRPGMHFLDLCTGSGCIAITLCCEKEGLFADASDLSGQALQIAEQNAGRFQADIRFIRSDLFDGLDEIYDMIVSNPPYISEEELKTLMPEVREHDPVMALSGGPDGLCFYRRITSEAAKHLHPGGFLLVEIGASQGAAVQKLFLENGFEEILLIRDLNECDRIVIGRRREDV